MLLAVTCSYLGESMCCTKAWSLVTAERSVVPVCESICYTETWSWVISVQCIVVKHMLHKSLVSGDSWAFSGSRGQAVLCVKAYAVQKSNLWLLQYNVPCPVYCVIAYMLHKSMVSCDSWAFSGSRGQVASCRKVLHWENTPLAYSLRCGYTVSFEHPFISKPSHSTPIQIYIPVHLPMLGGGGTFSTNSALCKYCSANHDPESLQNTHSCVVWTYS